MMCFLSGLSVPIAPQLHPNDVILNEPFLGSGRVKDLNLHEFGSGDRQVQSIFGVIARSVLRAEAISHSTWEDCFGKIASQ
jgi:hypothetical protein